MIIAGLDLSLRAAGVAVMGPGDEVHCYTVGSSLTKQANDRKRLQRLVDVTNGVMGILQRHKVTAVGIENYGFASHTLAFSAELGGNVRVQVWVGLGIMPVSLPSMSVRKYLLGKATKDKKVVRDHLRRLGYGQPTNTDESDALAVALVTRDYFARRETVSDVEKMNLFDRLDRQRSLD